MWCESQFTAFNIKVMLDATRQARIESAMQAFTSFCRSDTELHFALSEDPFLQGSVLTRTAIKPLAKDEFDVDASYPFSLGAFAPEHQNPRSILAWFRSRLEKNGFYAPRLKPKDRCVRIDYAGDFHMDLIPATADLANHAPCAVPARDLGDWITNNPMGFATWVAQKDTKGGGKDVKGDGYFVRSVRFMKRWRDQFFTEHASPSSMLLVAVLGKHDPSVKNYLPALDNALFPEHQQDAAYLYDLLRLTSSCLSQENRRRDAFENPSIPGEDLAFGWEKKNLDEFLTRLNSCVFFLGKGIWATSEAESIAFYQKAFGDTFPAS